MVESYIVAISAISWICSRQELKIIKAFAASSLYSNLQQQYVLITDPSLNWKLDVCICQTACTYTYTKNALTRYSYHQSLGLLPTSAFNNGTCVQSSETVEQELTSATKWCCRFPVLISSCFELYPALMSQSNPVVHTLLK